MHAHLIHDSLDLPLTIPRGNSIGSAVCHSLYTLHSLHPISSPPKKPLLWGSIPSSTTWFLGPTDPPLPNQYQCYGIQRQTGVQQEALLWQRDCATRLSVEILQLQNILFPGLLCDIICVILRLAVFTQYRSATHTHTHTHRQTDGRTDTALRCSVKIDHIALHTKYNYQATSVS